MVALARCASSIDHVLLVRRHGAWTALRLVHAHSGRLSGCFSTALRLISLFVNRPWPFQHRHPRRRCPSY